MVPGGSGFRRVAGRLLEVSGLGFRSFHGTRALEKLKPEPRGTEPVKPPNWGSPNENAGGGGDGVFKPTSEKSKKKALPKRCRAIVQAVERERVGEMHEWRPLQPFRPGDVVEVVHRPMHGKGRAMFRGICMAKKNRGLGSSFVLRNVYGTTSVERQFPLYSPNIEEVRVKERRKVRRAKLTYLRWKSLSLSKV